MKRLYGIVVEIDGQDNLLGKIEALNENEAFDYADAQWPEHSNRIELFDTTNPRHYVLFENIDLGENIH